MVGPDRRRLEAIAVVVALACIAGSVDVIGYLRVHGLFFGHMSGNTIGAAGHLAGGEVGAAAHHGFAVAGFVVGLVLGGVAESAVSHTRVRSKHAVLFGIELVLLGAVIAADALLGAGRLGRLVTSGLAAAAMGLQSAAASRVADIPVRTTFITGVLSNFVEETIASFANRDSRGDHLRRAAVFASIFAAFFLGGVLGGAIEGTLGWRALALPCAGLVVLVVRDIVAPFGATPPKLDGT